MHNPQNIKLTWLVWFEGGFEFEVFWDVTLLLVKRFLMIVVP
jgi:hypothetical protein